MDVQEVLDTLDNIAAGLRDDGYEIYPQQLTEVANALRAKLTTPAPTAPMDNEATRRAAFYAAPCHMIIEATDACDATLGGR